MIYLFHINRETDEIKNIFNRFNLIFSFYFYKYKCIWSVRDIVSISNLHSSFCNTFFLHWNIYSSNYFSFLLTSCCSSFSVIDILIWSIPSFNIDVTHLNISIILNLQLFSVFWKYSNQLLKRLFLSKCYYWKNFYFITKKSSRTLFLFHIFVCINHVHGIISTETVN